MAKASPIQQQSDIEVDPDDSRVAGRPATDDATPAPVPFEHALDELETIVRHMEDGTLSLDQSLAAYRRGAELVKVCESALEHVKEQVRVLDGELLRPLSEVPSRGSDRA